MWWLIFHNINNTNICHCTPILAGPTMDLQTDTGNRIWDVLECREYHGTLDFLSASHLFLEICIWFILMIISSQNKWLSKCCLRILSAVYNEIWTNFYIFLHNACYHSCPLMADTFLMTNFTFRIKEALKSRYWQFYILVFISMRSIVRKCVLESQAI